MTDDDDEVLEALAEELGGFVSHIGGPMHAKVLLPPLEALVKAEERAVREKVGTFLLCFTIRSAYVDAPVLWYSADRLSIVWRR